MLERLRRLLAQAGITDSPNHGAQSWSGNRCPSTCRDHVCAEERNHGYQHRCGEELEGGGTCGFRWAA